MHPSAAPLDTANLSALSDRQQAWFTTGRGPVFVRRYTRESDFVRAAVRSGNGRDRAALLTLHPEAYPLAPAWLAAIAESDSAGLGRERKGGQMYDGSTVASCSCGWRVTAESQLGARALAEQHRREATSGEPM